MRIIDNVFSNIYKYADITKPVSITVKNEDDKLVVIEFTNYISKDSAKAESNGIGLKTCVRLGRLITDGFEYGVKDGVFAVRLAVALYDPS